MRRLRHQGRRQRDFQRRFHQLRRRGFDLSIKKKIHFELLPSIKKILSIRQAKIFISIFILLSDLRELLAENTGDDCKNTRNLHFLKNLKDGLNLVQLVSR